jgi:hypothetical protein
VIAEATGAAADQIKGLIAKFGRQIGAVVKLGQTVGH